MNEVITAARLKTPESILSLRKQFPLLGTSMNNKPVVYLDNGATTQKPQQVIDCLNTYYSAENANVHRGIYALSEHATISYERVRARTAKFIGSLADEIVFTSGTTESINFLAQSLSSQVKAGDEILLTLLEHHSNLVPWQQLAKRTGALVRFCTLTPDGRLDMDDFKTKLNSKTKIVAVTHVSNVLGTIVDVKEISRLAHEHSSLVVVDGAQAVAHKKIDVKDIDCDFYCFSAHKMYGPTGVGVFYGKKHLLDALDPTSFGGGMISSVTVEGSGWAETPFKFEAGTPNIAGVIALGETLSFLQSLDWDLVVEHERALTSYLVSRLSAIEGVTVFGPSDKGPVISFSIDCIHPHDIAQVIAQEGICVRAGHHCAMPLMKQLGVSATTRASLGLYNTYEDIDRFIAAVKKVKQVFS